MGKLEGKVAFITGAARGQGRAHAIRLAEEGADIIGVDICDQIPVVPYQMGTAEELAETVAAVEKLGRKMVSSEVDVRYYEALQKAFDDGCAELGQATIVVANAGIGPGGFASDQEQWDEVISVNLSGVWNTGRVSIPSIVEANQGGSVILTSSTGGLIGPGMNVAGVLGYTAAKHGVIGLMRSWSNYLAPHFVRCNAVAPTTVATPMANMGDVSLILEHVPEMAGAITNAMPIDAVQPEDIAATVAWLASDDARYVTGSVIPVDAGNVNRR